MCGGVRGAQMQSKKKGERINRKSVSSALLKTATGCSQYIYSLRLFFINHENVCDGGATEAMRESKESRGDSFKKLSNSTKQSDAVASRERAILKIFPGVEIKEEELCNGNS